MCEKKDSGRLAWVSLICGVAAWPLAGPVPFVPGVAALIVGGVALGKLEKQERKLRVLAWVGIVLGGLSILGILLLYIWIFIAFMRNPVAH